MGTVSYSNTGAANQASTELQVDGSDIGFLVPPPASLTAVGSPGSFYPVTLTARSGPLAGGGHTVDLLGSCVTSGVTANEASLVAFVVSS